MQSLRQLSMISLFLLSGLTVLSQGQNEKAATPDLRISTSRCPTISVSCPSFKTGTLAFSAIITGLEPGTVPTYKWTAYGATIVEGQGTSTIKLSTDDWGGKGFTATVTMGGLHPACPSTASCSLLPGLPPPPSTKFDSYGVLPRKQEKERLDNFAAMLKNQPSAMGYILSYPARRQAGNASAGGERAKAYLVKEHSIEVGRIVTVSGGLKKKLTVDLWIVPTGAIPPKPEPTIDQGAIKPIKSPVRKTAKGHRRH